MHAACRTLLGGGEGQKELTSTAHSAFRSDASTLLAIFLNYFKFKNQLNILVFVHFLSSNMSLDFALEVRSCPYTQRVHISTIVRSAGHCDDPHPQHTDRHSQINAAARAGAGEGWSRPPPVEWSSAHVFGA